MLGSFIASAHSGAGKFFANLFTGVASGDPLSLVVVSIVALLILRFVLARWMWTLLKQTIIFGGLGYGVWFASGAITDRWGAGVGAAFRYGGLAIVGILFFAMVYLFFLRRARENASGTQKSPEGKARASAAATAPGAPRITKAGTPPGAPPAKATAAAAPTAASAAPDLPDEHHSRLEDMLKKVNVLGAAKDQNLLTVFVLILVAEFGVFTSKTVAAPSARIGMILFAIFLVGAIIFVKSSYKNYWTGVRHFVFATAFAVVLSVLMLVYWQTTYCDTSMLDANMTGGECPVSAQAAIDWSLALSPSFYFASDALIASITGVAFSTLLTKGAG